MTHTYILIIIFYCNKRYNYKTRWNLTNVCSRSPIAQGEIEHVLSLNVTPDRIIYANPCKTRSYIKHAKSRDVDLMTFDSEMELEKIATLYPECRLILRIKVDDSHSVCKFR